jgi:HlyD family secretion protein
MTTRLEPLHPDPWYLSLQKQLQSRWLIGLLLLGGIAGGGLTLYRALSPSQTAQSQILTAAIEQKSLPITFSANGTVKPERTINVSPKTSGVLKELLVKEGDRVKAGEILARMDNSNLQGQLIQAQAQLTAAQANLNKLLAGNRPQEIAQVQAQLTAAQASLQQAQINLNQNQRLYDAGAISQRDLDTSRTAYATAKAQVDQLQQVLNLQKSGTRTEEIAQARAQVESARGALQTIQTQINDAAIKAPFDGVVTKKYADPGSFVTPTTAGSNSEAAASNSILTLAATNQVVAYLDEAKISRVQVGAPVKITADAFGDRTFTGTVSQVAAQATTTQNVTSFEVRVSLEPAAQQLLKSGMSVEAQFQVGQLDNAILAPSAAIVRQQNGATGVYVMGDDSDILLR